MNKAERTALIKEAVEKTNEESRRKNSATRTERLWCKDDWQLFEVYSVPVDALVLNIDNRRFSAERKLLEEQLGHALDPENNPNDEVSVISILLDTGLSVDGDVVKGVPSRGYFALKDDWKKRHQESPFWIRPDGTVHNGNRRLAILKRMRAEEGIEGTRYIDAIILDPGGVDEQQLFEMEQREQLTENFKMRYTDINLLITLREAAEAREIDWNSPPDIERVAGELQHLVEGDKGYAGIQLRAIKYMDDYLRDLRAPGEYYMLMRQIERFRDVGKIMAKMIEDYPDHGVDMLRLLFAGITSGVKHGHIRSIGKIFREDRDEYERLLDRVLKVEEKSTLTSRLESPKVTAIEEDIDDDSEVDEPAPVVPDYPKDRVRSAIVDGIDGFDSKNLAVVRNLARVANRLRPLTEAHLSEALKGPDGEDTKSYLSEIVAWAEKAEKLL